MRSQHVLYTVTGGAVILTWNLGEQAKEDTPHASTAEGFGRYRKSAGPDGLRPRALHGYVVVGFIPAGSGQQRQTPG